MGSLNGWEHVRDPRATRDAYNPSGCCDHPYGPTFLLGGCKGAQIEKNGILEPIIWPRGSNALRHTLAPHCDPLRRYCPCLTSCCARVRPIILIGKVVSLRPGRRDP